MPPVEIGLAIAAVPAIIGAFAVERWRRGVVREWRRAEERARRRDEAWLAVDAVADVELDRAA